MWSSNGPVDSTVPWMRDLGREQSGHLTFKNAYLAPRACSVCPSYFQRISHNERWTMEVDMILLNTFLSWVVFWYFILSSLTIFWEMKRVRSKKRTIPIGCEPTGLLQIPWSFPTAYWSPVWFVCPKTSKSPTSLLKNGSLIFLSYRWTGYAKKSSFGCPSHRLLIKHPKAMFGIEQGLRWLIAKSGRMLFLFCSRQSRHND